MADLKDVRKILEEKRKEKEALELELPEEYAHAAEVSQGA